MAFTVHTVRNVFTSPWAKKGLAFVGNRYIPQTGSSDGLTLVFFHCAGSHKESWEPTIEYLFENVKDPETGAPFVREAWAFDMQNHGESAALNEEVMKEGMTGLTVEECGEAFKAFYAGGALHGHTLVGVGHSLGAPALMLSTVSGNLPGVEFKAIILIEPALIARPTFEANREDREAALKAMNIAISKRKDEWNTRDEAKQYFQKRFPWQLWDKRVLDLLIRHGLREVVVQQGGARTERVRLCCDKEHERRAYKQDEVYFDVVDRLQTLHPTVPVHYIYGERFELIPEWVYKSVMSVRTPASDQRVAEAGHFTPQEKPDEVGRAIESVLRGVTLAKL